MILDTAKSYLLREVAPLANEIDINPHALLKALRGLGNFNLLALRVPQKWGGCGVDHETFAKFQTLVARYSGALAFLQTQHQSAAGMLIQSDNPALQQEYLPRMGSGEKLLGVGFSHIRREGDPAIVAVPVAGGYQLDGFVPWVTGWNLFPEFIVAATLPDRSAVFGIIPFIEQQSARGTIRFSPPARLAAIASTNTVNATLTRLFLPNDRVVFVKGAEWIHTSDRKNILRATPLMIGCAMAGLDIVQAAATTKSLPFIADAYTALESELTVCQSAIAQAQLNADFSQKVQLRAWAIDLAVRCAHAAVTVSSGSANYTHHPAQRVDREALVFTVSGQTPAIMQATLNQLTSPQRYHPKQNLISYSSVIHLSHVIHPEIPQWLGDPPVEFETVAELEKDGYYLRRFSLGEHSATHINAPSSFDADGITIDQYPADSFVIPAVVIDIQTQAAANCDYVLSINDVLAWEQQYGEIPADCIVLLYTGWQFLWSRTAFLNLDASGVPHFPGFSLAVTEFLLEERHIAGVGIDTHGVDPGCDPTFAVNRLVLKKARIVLENLTNLDQLPARGSTLVIGVLRLQNGSGSPSGVMALIP